MLSEINWGSVNTKGTTPNKNKGSNFNDNKMLKANLY